MIFFSVWVASILVQLLCGIIGKYLPDAKYGGGYDPFNILLWVPILNTLVAIVCCMMLFNRLYKYLTNSR